MKNEYLTITIHDDKGIKQFNLHLVVKKVLKYIILAFFLILFIGTGALLYLNNSVDKIEKNKEVLQRAYSELKHKNSNLKDAIEQTQVSLRIKKKELNELSDSLREIENLIGISSDENSSIEQRVNITKLSSEQRMALLQFIPNGSPITYKGITSKYGMRINPLLKTKEFHNGTDMRAKMNTPVYATADGIVEWAGYHKKSGYGNLVILAHNYGFKSYFGHLSRIVVRSEQFVKKGDLIAYTGTSGMSSGPHLHYEIRYLYQSINPYWFIKWNMKNYNQIFQKVKHVPWKSLVEATSKITINKQATKLLTEEIKKRGN